MLGQNRILAIFDLPVFNSFIKATSSAIQVSIGNFSFCAAKRSRPSIVKEIDDNGTIKTIEYAYSGAEVIQEFAAGTGVENKTFVYGPGIDNPIYMDAVSSGTSYFGTNSIGSITALSDSSGNLLESYEYRPFGEETIKNASGTVISGTAYANPYMFTARRKDYEEGSNLYHFRTRQYSAITGRFISHDSLGDWGDQNQMGNGMNYCHNDPINYKDPFGLEEKGLWDKIKRGVRRTISVGLSGNVLRGGVTEAKPLRPKRSVNAKDSAAMANIVRRTRNAGLSTFLLKKLWANMTKGNVKLVRKPDGGSQFIYEKYDTCELRLSAGVGLGSWNMLTAKAKWMLVPWEQLTMRYGTHFLD